MVVQAAQAARRVRIDVEKGGGEGGSEGCSRWRMWVGDAGPRTDERQDRRPNVVRIRERSPSCAAKIKRLKQSRDTQRSPQAGQRCAVDRDRRYTTQASPGPGSCADRRGRAGRSKNALVASSIHNAPWGIRGTGRPSCPPPSGSCWAFCRPSWSSVPLSWGVVEPTCCARCLGSPRQPLSQINAVRQVSEVH